MTDPAQLLRPVRESDFDEVLYLVGTIGDGLTSLPQDPDYIAHRIDDSLRAFDSRIRKPGGETYLFVLEDLSSGKIIGTSGLLSRVGGFDPFYTYELRSISQEYAPLDIKMELESLHLLKNHKGPTEICSLFLHKDYRKSGLGKLLSLPRFCFMKTFPERFDDQVIAELRGYIDETGHSPFWEAVGQKFFQNDYYTADILSGLGDKDFIEVLMPKFPIYVTLLPEAARKTIGKVHQHTAPAQEILLKEGFKKTNEVDIFDAGPILTAPRNKLKTWKNSHLASIIEGNPVEGASRKMIITNQSLDFRAILTDAQVSNDGGLVLPVKVAAMLELMPGETAMYLILDT